MQQQKDAELSARELGFNKVSELKLQVAKSIKEFIAGGGFLFTMCSGTDSYDIALSAENTDICEYMMCLSTCVCSCKQIGGKDLMLVHHCPNSTHPLLANKTLGQRFLIFPA